MWYSNYSVILTVALVAVALRLMDGIQTAHGEQEDESRQAQIIYDRIVEDTATRFQNPGPLTEGTYFMNTDLMNQVAALKSNDAIDVLFRLLQHPHDRNRQMATCCLGAVMGPDAAPVLISLLVDESVAVRRVAFWELMGMYPNLPFFGDRKNPLWKNDPEGWRNEQLRLSMYVAKVGFEERKNPALAKRRQAMREQRVGVGYWDKTDR